MRGLAEIDVAHTRIGRDLLRRALGQQRAGDEDGNAIGEAKDEVHVVFDQQHADLLRQRRHARQNVLALGLAVSHRLGKDAQWWRRLGSRAQVVDEAAALIEQFQLADVMGVPVASLPYGKQRLLEIALAIACRPRVLLLDEPAAGVPEAEREDILASVAALPREVSVLLIEHDMDLVFRFADRISVLVAGAVLTEGTPEEVAADPRVRDVYLGEAAHG